MRKKVGNEAYEANSPKEESQDEETDIELSDTVDSAIERTIEAITDLLIDEAISAIEGKEADAEPNKPGTISMTESNVTCGMFDYNGDQDSIGSRWDTWLERFKLYIQSKNLTEPKTILANFLLLIGPDAYDV